MASDLFEERMRFATFNIYWFGTSRPVVARGVADDALVARVLAGLDADVLALQEICDPTRLASVIAEAARLSGRDLRVRDGERFVTSARDDDLTDGAAQKVFFAWDAARVAPVAWGPIDVPALRPPLRARFADGDGVEVEAVAVHLKSGRLGAPMGDADADRRHAEAAALADVLRLGADRALLLGDLNARTDDPSIAPLTSLPGWSWRRPAVPADDPWTTYLDRDVIDLVGVGPGLATVAPPVAWDWDRDPTIAPPGYFQRVDDFVAQRARHFPRAPVENLYRVSDHRPVRISVR